MRATTTLELKRQHAGHKSKTTTCPVCRMIEELDDALEVLDELSDLAGDFVDDVGGNTKAGPLELELRASIRKANQLLAKRPS